jgi:hypothetical protein
MGRLAFAKFLYGANTAICLPDRPDVMDLLRAATLELEANEGAPNASSHPIAEGCYGLHAHLGDERVCRFRIITL